MPLKDLYIGHARHDGAGEGDGKRYPRAEARRIHHGRAREGHARPALGLRQDPHPPLDRVSGRRRCSCAPARRRHARRPARRHHRHQSAACAAGRHARTCGGALDEPRLQRPRRPRARPDHVDEDDLHARPLPPARRRRSGAAAGAAAVCGLI